MASKAVEGGRAGSLRAVAQVKGRSTTVRFGSVTVTGPKPSAAEVKINVDRSTAALERVGKRLAKPGVVIRAKRGVPLFSVADDDPDIFIRELDGRVDRGRVVDGQFQAID